MGGRSDHATLEKTYQYYEVPLSGIISQHGARFFFGCVGGPSEPANFWIYARVNSQEEHALDSSTPSDFGAAVDFVGPVVMALALEGPGIVAYHVIDYLNSDGLMAARDALMAELEEQMAAAREVQLSYAT